MLEGVAIFTTHHLTFIRGIENILRFVEKFSKEAPVGIDLATEFVFGHSACFG